MANFRIDSLIIERNNDGTYNYSGTCNADAGNTQTVVGVYDDNAKETTYNCAANTANDKINFSVNDIDYSNYNPAEMMAHTFVDAASPGTPVISGKNTPRTNKFPPPSSQQSRGPLNSITDDFKLDKISVQRKTPLNSQDEFTMQIDVSFSSQTTNHTNGSAVLATNSYFGIDIVTLEFSSNKDGQSNSGSFSFPVQCSGSLPLRLKDYAADGLPITIKDIATIWPDVNKKIALITIE